MSEGFDLVGPGQLGDEMKSADLVPLTADYMDSDSNALMATFVVDATGDMEVQASGTGVDVGALPFLPGQESTDPVVAEVSGSSNTFG